MIGVKIDNTAAGFPQYGVSAADIVYVEQVEGGLTRLLAVFHTNLPTEVGAVRSVRTTDAELLPMFGTPALVFSGGAGGPLAALASTPIVERRRAVGFWRSGNAAGALQRAHRPAAGERRSSAPLSPAQGHRLRLRRHRPAARRGAVHHVGPARFQAAQGGVRLRRIALRRAARR